MYGSDNLFFPCGHCRNAEWCKRHGCTTWNDKSRLRLKEVKLRSQENDDLMDEIERAFGLSSL